jgi:hypothetical protein
MLHQTAARARARQHHWSKDYYLSDLFRDDLMSGCGLAKR